MTDRQASQPRCDSQAETVAAPSIADTSAAAAARETTVYGKVPNAAASPQVKGMPTPTDPPRGGGVGRAAGGAKPTPHQLAMSPPDRKPKSCAVEKPQVRTLLRRSHQCDCAPTDLEVVA